MEHTDEPAAQDRAAQVRAGQVGAELDPAGDRRAWARLAPAGLLLVGAGTSVAADASSRRAAGAVAARWAGEGALGLVLLNAGLCLFGEAVKRRARHDVARALAGA